jgi:hypothetical protein
MLNKLADRVAGSEIRKPVPVLAPAEPNKPFDGRAFGSQVSDDANRFVISDADDGTK